jgi:hypothetical protein
MKKSMLMGLVAMCAAGILITGCNQQQITLVARQAGIAAVATWVSVDNPTDAQRSAAKGVVTIIKEKSSLVSSNAGYYTVLMPVVNEYIAKSVQPKDQMICQLAGGWLLTGLDTIVAMNPGWIEKQSVAIEVVSAFCDGASMGLSMAKDDPVMVAAARSSKARESLRAMNKTVK